MVIFGDLSPIKVSNERLNQPPHNLIGALLYENRPGMVELGTGILISPDLVLTSAQNIYSQASIKYPASTYYQFRFYIGQHGHLESTYAQVMKWYIPKEFILKNTSTTDYALLRLAKQIPIETFVPLKFVDHVENDQKIAIFGYSEMEKRSRDPYDSYDMSLHQWGLTENHNILQCFRKEKKEILYHLSTFPGQAGAPLLLISKDQSCSIIGIHKGSVKIQEKTFNVCRHITLELIQQLRMEAKKLGAVPFLVEGEDIKQSAKEQMTEPFQIGKIPKFQNLQKQTLEEDKAMVKDIFERGCIFEQQERFQEAFECFERVIALDPKHLLAHSKKEQTLLKLIKDQDEEIKSCSRILTPQKLSNPELNILGRDYLDPSHPPVKVPTEKMKKLPHLLIGSIIVEDYQDKIAVGTGILISPDLVLTVAHNLFYFRAQRLNRNIRFFPNQKGPFGKQYEVKFYYFPEAFPRFDRPTDDYAILKLSEKIDVEDFIKLKGDFREIQKNQRIALFGYSGGELFSLKPQDLYKHQLHQWGTIRGADSILKIDRVKGELIHDISTLKGQSGAPIILIDSAEDMSIVGIHKGGKINDKGNNEKEYNVARLLTPNMIDELKRQVSRWKAVPFLEVQQIERSTISKIQDLQILFDKATQMMKKEKYEEAKKALEKVFMINKKNLKAHCWLAQLLLKQKKYQQALQVSQKAIGLDQKEPLGHSFKGWALNGLGRPKQALLSCQTAVKLNPKDINANNNIGFAYILLQKFQSALEWYQKIIEFNDRDAFTHNNIGFALYSLRKMEEATNQYRQAIKLNSKCASAYNNLGRLQMDQKNYQDAQLNIRRAIELDPFSNYYVNLISLADNYIEQLEEMRFLERIMEEHPSCQKAAEAYKELKNKKL